MMCEATCPRRLLAQLISITLICSEPEGHEGVHYDDTFNESWPRYAAETG